MSNNKSAKSVSPMPFGRKCITGRPLVYTVKVDTASPMPFGRKCITGYRIEAGKALGAGLVSNAFRP